MIARLFLVLLPRIKGSSIYTLKDRPRCEAYAPHLTAAKPARSRIILLPARSPQTYRMHEDIAPFFFPAWSISPSKERLCSPCHAQWDHLLTSHPLEKKKISRGYKMLYICPLFLLWHSISFIVTYSYHEAPHPPTLRDPRRHSIRMDARLWQNHPTWRRRPQSIQTQHESHEKMASWPSSHPWSKSGILICLWALAWLV